MAYKVVAKPVDGSEASWTVSWKIVGHESKQSFQSADITFEQSSAPVDFALHDAGVRVFLESAKGDRSELQPADLGHPQAFEFLLETLEATGEKGPRAIKLVTPHDKGNIIRSDIVPQRMQDLEYIEKTTAFAQPLQLFSGEEWTASTEFATLFKSSAGVIRLRDIPTTQITDAALQVLESELHNRLPTPLVVAGLKRRTIVFLEGSEVLPNRGGCAARFYGAAESLGIDLVVLAVEGHWLQGSEYAHWRKAFIPIEFGFDADFPSRIVAAVRQYDGPVDGILTIFDSYQIALSIAATELGLPTEPTSAYEVATDKYKMSAFEGRKSFVAASAEEAMKIAQTEDLPWPIIVKPCRGFGSELVFRVDNIEQLAAVAGRMNSARHGTEFVIEHYCDGPEVDINFVVYDGKILFHEIGDEDPKSAEDGSDSFHERDCCSPTELPKPEQAVLHDSIAKTLNRLGFRNGIYHCEARVDDSTVEWRRTESNAPELVPRSTHSSRPPSSWLIEINPRPPGCNSSDVIETTWGVDYWAVLLSIRLHDSDRVRAFSQPYRNGPQYFADMIFISAAFDKSKNGVWESGEVTEELVQRRPDLGRHISKHLTFMRKGDSMPHPSTGVNTFVAYLNVFSRRSRAHVLDIAAAVRKELRIEYS
ncbi:uncharacterized protein TRUGW13939_06994 [Talaromyces rugulosus]|uniref:ATP-grasp domain-containing protein n=1 Tax=Talaromyces rugulosus TaxID=121627 RepID=A0A7H8R0H4_TALRU|nr:uncharacterized protein TRUGW13939_06994 [Talaromyces rugulosus]QKX59852.1 hypothetical protein TRUGW13939_06994 [Talaromyces rugulosus]